MTTLALKKKIFVQLKDAQNKSLLENIYRLLVLENENTPVVNLTESQVKKIKSGQAQIRKGETKSNASVIKNFNKWLEK